MARLYTKKVWFNDQTKLSAKNLNHIEKGIEAVAGAIDELEAISKKVMTDDERTKLSGIDAGAQVNKIESIKVNGTEVKPDSNKEVNITVDASGVAENTVSTHNTSSTAHSDIRNLVSNAQKKADLAYSLIDGSPRGVYANLSALQTAYPSGANGVYLTSDNGHWYYWNGSAWSDGGVYHTTEIADKSISLIKLDTSVTDILEKESIITTRNYSMAVGNYINTTLPLEPSADTNYEYAVVDCNPGDLFYLNVRGGNNPRAYAFIDSSNKVLEVAPSNKTMNGIIFTPADAVKLIVNNMKTAQTSVIAKNVGIKTNIIGYNLYKSSAMQNGMYYYGKNMPLGSYNVGDTVSLTPAVVPTFKYLIINVTAGDEYIINTHGGSNPRAYAFLDETNKLIYKAEANAIIDSIVTVPIGATKLIVNFNIAYESTNVLYKCGDTFYALDYKINQLANKEKGTNYPVFTNFNANSTMSAYINGVRWSNNLQNPIMDFKKDGDLMVHVSTFRIINNIVYFTYYANTRSSVEKPSEQTARFGFCNLDTPNNKTFYDLQDVGEMFNGYSIQEIYDTILLTKDDNILYLMWTAKYNNNYARLYRTYNISTGELSEISINQFKVGTDTGDFTVSSMKTLLNNNNIDYKTMSDDIGIMQRLTSRVENGVTYYYTGCYVGYFNCIIKSTDLITWEYVSAPTFSNDSQWENTVYVIGDNAYYFCRQTTDNPYGFLTKYDIVNKVWAEPMLINDCQSRSDFFEYNGQLMLLHAPVERGFLSLLQINTTSFGNSLEIQTAYIPNTAFYPFVQEYNGQLYISYTQNRQHLYLCRFSIWYVGKTVMDSKFLEMFS